MSYGRQIDWNRFWTMVKAAGSIAVTSHVRPDGDSLGSQLAMVRAVRALGKEVLPVNSDPVPPSLRFLDPQGTIRPLDELTAEEREQLNNADLFLSLDTSSWAQLGKMAEFFRRDDVVKAVIDHHVLNSDLKAEFFVDSDAPATGSLVYQAIVASGLPLTQESARDLFVAVATDTGWFRFASTQAETYLEAAALVRAGVRPDAVYREVYEQESLGRIRLIGRALAKTESLLDGKLMLTSLLLSDFDAAGAHPSESEDIVNITLQTAGSRMAVILVEQRTGGFKISFRSRCAVDCSRLASQFGGGGHEAAAGAFLPLAYDEARSALVEAFAEASQAAGI